ncbi:MAG TPA: hypothetical protein VGO93_26725 [Candidatus Xenobia bacterium]|jgi:hypothetical protein
MRQVWVGLLIGLTMLGAWGAPRRGAWEGRRHRHHGAAHYWHPPHRRRVVYNPSHTIGVPPPKMYGPVAGTITVNGHTYDVPVASTR